ncbi:MAG: phosphatase PAP2 family protein [Planctomycetota bacterium]
MAVMKRLERYEPGGAASDLMNAAEVFGNGFGVLLVVVAVAVLDRVRRVEAWRLLLCSLGAGVAANVVKLLIPRTRPYATELADVGVAETFLAWVPILERGSSVQSFPSAHTATAAGLAFGLAAMYPHGRKFFYALIAGVAMQRMIEGFHYPSDVLVGGTLGASWARLCQPNRLVGRWYEVAVRWSQHRWRPAPGIAVFQPEETGDSAGDRKSGRQAA